MESLQNLLDGFLVALTFENLLWVFIGVTLGTIVGVLPGLGPPATLAILLPVTLTLNPTTGLIMMAGVYYGAKYGGSTTSILLNVPGESASVVTALDGYQLAKQGRAGAALGIAAIASFVAGTFGVLGVSLLALPIARWALNFGPPEYFTLMLMGIVAAVFLAGRSIIKGLISAVLGLLLATIGADIVSGEYRFVYGQFELLDGIQFIALSIGIFAIGEVLVNLEERSGKRLFAIPTKLRDLFPSRKDLADSRLALAQGSVLGFVVGVLPGAGSTVASFLAYAVQKRISRHPERFGKGAIEGVAAPEGANNASASAELIPLLALGIPGSGTAAVMLGILILYGLQPGPLLFTERPDVVWPVIASMYLGNVALLVLNLPLAPLWASILRFPYYVIYPGILIVSIVGVFSYRGSMFDVWTLAFFGLLGYAMRRLDIPAPPLALAFVLGPLAERAFRQSLILSESDLTIFVTRPIALVLLLLTAVFLLAPLLGVARRLRTQVVDEDASS